MNSRGSYSQYNRYQLNLAAHIFRCKKYTSIRACARDYGVPRSTLTDHLKSNTNASIGYKAQQGLSKFEEDMVVDWIISQDRTGWPPTPADVRRFASLILEAHDDHAPLG
jgi:hypothetical protein